jgi:N-acetyl-gamma-glutamyl-phosphate reductase
MNTLANANTILEEATQPQLTPTGKTPRTAISGVSGYAGGELVRLLTNHPRFASSPLTFYGRTKEGAHESHETLLDLQPHLFGTRYAQNQIQPFNWKQVEDAGIEHLYLATPHEQSRELVPHALERGIRVIDLSGAWRLQQQSNRAIYKMTDAAPELAANIQTRAAYGSPELHRDQIRSARIVANPGCYATSIILPLAPLTQSGLVDLDRGIICDSKSGVSGAGKTPTANTHFMYAADNLSAYGVFGHRHTGELLEQLHLTSDQIQFTPHLLPIPRGILSTIYLRFTKPAQSSTITSLFQNFYKDSPLVRLRVTPQLPQIQYVVRTNYCDIGFKLSHDGRNLVIISCLDNLLKGAAGQAVQNMNLMYGWGETEGLL